MKILSIDPGYERLGIAIVEKNLNSREELLYSDCFKTSSKLSFTERLFMIGTEIERIVIDYKPNALSIENLYFYTNQKTAMNVSQVRGVILYIAQRYNLSIYEYTPLQIKAAITGYGQATKDQMMLMVPKLITIHKKIQHDDEFDAIAIGLTCFASERFSL